MAPEVIKHSEGMISVDAEEVKTDSNTVEFMKQTHLYQELVSKLGSERADQIIENGEE